MSRAYTAAPSHASHSHTHTQQQLTVRLRPLSHQRSLRAPLSSSYLSLSLSLSYISLTVSLAAMEDASAIARLYLERQYTEEPRDLSWSTASPLSFSGSSTAASLRLLLPPPIAAPAPSPCLPLSVSPSVCGLLWPLPLMESVPLPCCPFPAALPPLSVRGSPALLGCRLPLCTHRPGDRLADCITLCAVLALWQLSGCSLLADGCMAPVAGCWWNEATDALPRPSSSDCHSSLLPFPVGCSVSPPPLPLPIPALLSYRAPSSCGAAADCGQRPLAGKPWGSSGHVCHTEHTATTLQMGVTPTAWTSSADCHQLKPTDGAARCPFCAVPCCGCSADCSVAE